MPPHSSSISDHHDMNPILRFCQNAAASTLTVMVLISAASSAHAIVVNIDPAQSSVTYTAGGFSLCDPEGNCAPLPSPQTFTLSGSFNVTTETVSYPVWFDPSTVFERDEIQLGNLAVDSGGATALGFSFPTYRGVLSGFSFTASEDLCSFLPSSGGCFSFGQFGNFSGTFDGTTRSMSGIDYAGNFFPDQFSFTVVARTANLTNVPEPSTLACVAVAAIGLIAAGRRRRRSA